MLKKLGTLKVRFSIITFFTYLTLIIVILIACNFRFYRNMTESYERLGNEVLNLAAEDIVIDSIPGYISGDYDRKEYENSLQKLNLYPQHFPEIFYLYAYQLKDDGENATYLFDAKVDHDEPFELGDNYELEEDIRGQIKKHGAGGQLDMVMDETEWGYLMTCSKPLVDSKGVFQGYLLVDFDLTRAKNENLQFILRLFIVIFALMLVIFALGMKAVADRITRPIEKIFLCLSGFRYSSAKDREDNIRKLKELDIHTNEEIQSLYEALVSTTEDSLLYMNEFRTATEKLGVANEKAYTDALTGVRNKTAYEDRGRELQRRSDNGEMPEIAVIMADINDLKYVNDKYGHKRGDDYIKGCCRIIEALCGESQIYRVGGDEFVIIMEGEDYRRRKSIYEELRARFADAYNDTSKDRWERYSASLGMAEYESRDAGLSDVLKRADSAMYRAKAIFKQENGSYR